MSLGKQQFLYDNLDDKDYDIQEDKREIEIEKLECVVRSGDGLWWDGFFEYMNHISKESAPSEVIDALYAILWAGLHCKLEDRHKPISILMDAVIKFKAEELYKNEHR